MRSEDWSEEKKQEFDDAAKPLLVFMATHCQPHMRIIIDGVHAELVEGVAVFTYG